MHVPRAVALSEDELPEIDSQAAMSGITRYVHLVYRLASSLAASVSDSCCHRLIGIVAVRGVLARVHPGVLPDEVADWREAGKEGGCGCLVPNGTE